VGSNLLALAFCLHCNYRSRLISQGLLCCLWDRLRSSARLHRISRSWRRSWSSLSTRALRASRNGTSHVKLCPLPPSKSNTGFTAESPHRPPAFQLTIRRLAEAIEAPENEQFPLGGAGVHATLTISLQLCCALEKFGLLPHGFCHFLPLHITISSLA
jgi:hypothetical protein